MQPKTTNNTVDGCSLIVSIALLLLVIARWTYAIRPHIADRKKKRIEVRSSTVFHKGLTGFSVSDFNVFLHYLHTERRYTIEASCWPRENSTEWLRRESQLGTSMEDNALQNHTPACLTNCTYGICPSSGYRPALLITSERPFLALRSAPVCIES